MKDILIFVKDAKYYPDQGSLVIVGAEVETKKPLTQQITVKAFLEGTGFTSEEVAMVVSDADRCRLLANQLRERKHPLKITFSDTKTEEDEI